MENSSDLPYLSNEIWLTIFSFLDNYIDLVNCRKICKLFRDNILVKKETGKNRETIKLENYIDRFLNENRYDDYQNIKKYVSSAHLLESFCLPIILPRYFKKPRS